MISSIRNSIKNIKTSVNSNTKNLIIKKVNPISFKILSITNANFHNFITNDRISNFSLTNKNFLEKAEQPNLLKINKFRFKYRRDLKVDPDDDEKSKT